MIAGGSEEAEASEKGDMASVKGEKTATRAGDDELVALIVGDGVGRGEEAAVVMGRSMAVRMWMRRGYEVTVGTEEVWQFRDKCAAMSC